MQNVMHELNAAKEKFLGCVDWSFGKVTCTSTSCVIECPWISRLHRTSCHIHTITGTSFRAPTRLEWVSMCDQKDNYMQMYAEGQTIRKFKVVYS